MINQYCKPIHSWVNKSLSSGLWRQVLPRVERTLAAGVLPLAARRGDRRVISNRFDMPQGVAHQAARRVFLVGVKNRLMPRELAASVLQALATLSSSKRRTSHSVYHVLTRIHSHCWARMTSFESIAIVGLGWRNLRALLPDWVNHGLLLNISWNGGLQNLSVTERKWEMGRNA
jgi:hypothetical protein